VGAFRLPLSFPREDAYRIVREAVQRLEWRIVAEDRHGLSLTARTRTVVPWRETFVITVAESRGRSVAWIEAPRRGRGRSVGRFLTELSGAVRQT